MCVNRGWSSWRGLGEWRARGQGLLGGSDQTSKHRVKHSWLRGTASFKAPLYYILNPVVNHIYFLLLLHLFNEPFEGYWSLPCFTTVLQTPQEPQDSQLHENDSKTIIQSLNRPCLSNLCWKKKVIASMHLPHFLCGCLSLSVQYLGRKSLILKSSQTLQTSWSLYNTSERATRRWVFLNLDTDFQPASSNLKSIAQ